MFDYYLASNTTISFIQAGFNNSNTRFGEIVKGEATPVVLTKTLFEGETISSIDFQTGFTNPAIYIDNIRIYYDATPALAAINVSSIRVASPTGIRFVGFANTALRTTADEFGFIVAADNGTADYSTDLVFADGERVPDTITTNSKGIKYTYSANYIKDTKNIIYSETGDFLPDELSMGDDGAYFTAVMIGIPERSYNVKLCVRPYVVVSGKTFYGNVVSRSLYEVAKYFKDSDSYVENEVIESIVNAVEKE